MRTYQDVPVRVFNDKDVDAVDMKGGMPVNFFNLFRAVLVDGYGTGDNFKAGLGWSVHLSQLETDDPNYSACYIVFKSKNSKVFFEIRCAASDLNNEGSTFYFGAYQSYVAYDNKGDTLTPYNEELKSDATSTSSKYHNYVIIGHGDAFYYMTLVESAYQVSNSCAYQNHISCYVGVYDSFVDNDPYDVIFAMKIDTSSSIGWGGMLNYALVNAGEYSFQMPSLDGSTTDEYSFGILGESNLSGSTSASAIGQREAIVPNFKNQVLLWRGDEVLQTNASTSRNDPNLPLFRGKLGAFCSFDLIGYYDDNLYPTWNFQTHDNVLYFQVPSCTNSPSNLWVNCEVW